MEVFQKVIIPRFKYSYTLSDVFQGIGSLFRKEEPLPSLLNELFPESDIYLTGNARTGIKYALKAFKLKKGANVGVQPYTCSSVLSAIRAADLTPFYVDINAGLTLSCEDLANKIARIDALIVTHTFGFPAEIDKIKKIASHLPIIEDCAHALFSHYQHRPLGTFFDASVFSFGNGKFPSLGGGGMLVVNNKALKKYDFEMLSQLPKPAMANELSHLFKSYFKALAYAKIPQLILNTFLKDTYITNRNKQVIAYKMPEYQMYKSAKMHLKLKLPKFERLADLQYNNGIYISTMLNGSFAYVSNRSEGLNYFAFVLFEKKREALFTYLKRHRIICGKHFNHSLSWALANGYTMGDCPLFEEKVAQIITVPCNYGLSNDELNKMIYHLLEFRKTHLS